MIFPQLGPEYYNDRHNYLQTAKNTFYAEAITINLSFWNEADVDTRFWCGDQTIYSDVYGNLPVNRRRTYYFNRVRPIVESVVGYQRRNRKTITVIPVESGNEKTADQFTKIFANIATQQNLYETISESFHGSSIVGLNFLHVWLDFRNDPVSGDIRVDNCSYNSFLVDPYFRKADLSDCNALWKRSFLTKQECISLMPDHAEEILNLTGNESGNGRDGLFHYMPESYNYGIRNLLTYDEFYYKTLRTQKNIVDINSGESYEWESSDMDKLRYFLQLHPELKLIEQDIPTVNVAISIQDRTFYDGPNPLGIDEYPFIPVMAYFTPQLPYYPWRIQGIVRSLRDPQFLYNRIKVIQLDMFESQINSGFKYKENALVNPSDVFLSGQGKGLALKREANMTDVEQIVPPGIPQSVIELSNLLAEDMTKVSGISEESMGMDVSDIAGTLAMLRQKAATLGMETLFDNLDRAQKILGKIMLKVIQRNYTPGKIQKILVNDQPTEEFYNKNFGKYDIAIEDGFNTSTQRQTEFLQLVQLRQLGINIPDSVLIEAATIQNKQHIIDQMNAEKQQVEHLQQQQLQAQLAEQQSRIKLAEARAIADRGLGVERVSRVEENKALAEERKAAAVKDEDIGLLNLIRSLKEIESVDIDNLKKLKELQSQLYTQSEVEKPTNVSPSA